MDPFTANFLSSLAAGLAGPVVNGLGRTLRDRILGTPAEQALEHSLAAGVVALTVQTTGVAPQQEDELRLIFERFFHDPLVGGQVASLLRGYGLDRERMAELFAEAGYSEERFPGLKFDEALDAFTAAFLEAADAEPALKDIIQTGLLRQQAGLQAELLAEMKKLVAALKEHGLGGVRGGEVLGEDGRAAYTWPSVIVSGEGATGIGIGIGRDNIGPVKVKNVTKNYYPPNDRRPGQIEPVAAPGLPRRVPFFGRDREFRIALEALRPDVRGWGVIISGMGGIGKTALAIEVAHECITQKLFQSCLFTTAKKKEFFPIETEVWDSVSTLPEMLDELARQLDAKQVTRLRGIKKRRAFEDELRSRSNSQNRILVIFDNLETLPDQEQDDVLHLLRVLPNPCKAIVTSRLNVVDSAVPLPLEALSQKGAQNLIDSELQRASQSRLLFEGIEAKDWKRLIDASGGSPLVLQLSIALMRKRQIGLNRVIDLLRKGDMEGGGYLDFIFQEIQKDMSRNDWRALSALVQLPPTTQFSELQEVLKFSRIELETMLSRLSDYSVLNFQGPEGPYAINELTRQWIDRYLERNPAERSGLIVLQGNFRRATAHIVNQYLAAPGEPIASETEFGLALSRYLEWLRRRYSRVKLQGIETNTQSLDMSIKDLYVSLSVEFVPVLRSSRRHTSSTDEETSFKNIVHIEELLSISKRWVIVGPPGSGKTTYLSMIASSLAESLLSSDSTLASQRFVISGALPVIVSLAEYNRFRREYHAIGQPRLGTLVGYVGRQFVREHSALDLPEDFFDRLLARSQPFVFLLDGLDEIPDELERAKVRAEIESLALSGSAYILVASRKTAYQGESVFSFVFSKADILPMSIDQIHQLIDLWCNAVYEPIGGQRKAESLKSTLNKLETARAMQGLSRLIDTPLMVTMLAAVHYQYANLPEQRVAMYDEFVRTLLMERYKPVSESKFELMDWGGTFHEKRELLAVLAFEMMKAGSNEGRQVDEQQVHNWLQTHLAPSVSGTEAASRVEVFLRAMRERASILYEYGPGTYTFTNLNFQEFLAATYLADNIAEQADIIDFLITEDRLTDPWWRETILLTAGYIGLRSTDRALRLLKQLAAVTAPGASDVELPLSAVELAGTAFLELDNRDETTRAMLADRLTALLTDPHLTATNQLRGLAGAALGRLGDDRPEVMDVDAMQFCLVPGGDFRMGGDEEEREQPLHTNPHLTYDYWMGRHPISNAQFAAFVADKGYEQKQFWPEAVQEGFWSSQGFKGRWDDDYRTAPLKFGSPYNLPNHPAVGISWYEALAFARWLAARWRDRGLLPQGWGVALPSEAEWEKAARGGLLIPAAPVIRAAGEIAAPATLAPAAPELQRNPRPERRFPWGDEPDAARLNSEESAIGATSALGAFPAGRSVYGCEELSGNVWEWTRSLWGTDYSKPSFGYPYEPGERREDLAASSGVARVLRGGSYYNKVAFGRCALRGGDDPDGWFASWGARVLVAPSSSPLISDPSDL